MYQLAGNYIKRLKDGAFIPVNESNQDYRAYKLWRDGRTETVIPESVIDGITTPGYTLEAMEPHIPLVESPDQYKANRKSEYPNVADQLDMIYHDLENWRTQIKAIKDKHPEPTEVL